MNASSFIDFSLFRKTNPPSYFVRLINKNKRNMCEAKNWFIKVKNGYIYMNTK